MSERQTATTLAKIRSDHVKRYEWAAAQVDFYSPALCAVTDAACGCGYGSAILAWRGDMVAGCDNSAEALAFAAKHWTLSDRQQWHQVDLAAGPWVPMSDVVISFETIEHLADPAAALQAFKASGAKRLFGSVPNEAGLPFTAKRFPFHYRHYTAPELRALLAANGWQLYGLWGQRDVRGVIEDHVSSDRTIVFAATA